MIILGVDPALKSTGFAVLQAELRSVTILEYGRIVTPSDQAFEVRLKMIYDELCEVISRHGIDVMALEQIFYGQNVQVALKMSHVRGVALLAAANHHLRAAEYSPREIKQAVTGNGNASKHQVQQMMVRLLNLPVIPEIFDVTDAMAVAYCHSQRGHDRSQFGAAAQKQI